MSGKETDFARKTALPQPAIRPPLDRPYACDYPGCPSRFTRNDELRRHQRLMEHGPASSRHVHEATLANGGQATYSGGRRRGQFEQSAARGTSYAQSGVLRQSSSRSNQDRLPPQAATSMNSYPSSVYPRHAFQQQSSSMVQPSPGHPGHNPAFMLPPATPTHPPLPSHNRTPTAPVRLSPSQTNYDTTDSGRRRRHVQPPVSSDVAEQPRNPNHSQR